jgi:type IV secretion system protein VirB10
MSQNMPPNPPGRSDEEGDSSASYGRDHDRDADARDQTSNPYYASQQGAPPPDLDANAPQLRSNELQRLNRKALLFLAGIIALLVVAAFWMIKSAGSGDDKVAKPVREEKVVIPELPGSAGAPAESEAIQVEQYAATPTLPTFPPEQPEHPTEYADVPPEQRAPTLMERRMSAGADSANVGAPGNAYGQPMVPGAQPVAPPENEASSAQFIYKPDALLVRGTYIRCVLETRIITDIPGFASCVVTEPIYSINGRSLLLPKGSKISGRYNNAGATGPRVAVIWDRITTPNGIDVSMASPGVDNLGGAGHPGDYDAHWGSRIASALLISLISDAFSYAAAENGPRTTTITNGTVLDTPFESTTARTMERLANQALDKSINRPPTVTINQGTVVNVYVSKDVDFSNVLARN